MGNQISKVHSYGRSCIAGCECGSFRSRGDRVEEKLGKFCIEKNTDGEREREKLVRVTGIVNWVCWYESRRDEMAESDIATSAMEGGLFNHELGHSRVYGMNITVGLVFRSYSSSHFSRTSPVINYYPNK